MTKFISTMAFALVALLLPKVGSAALLDGSFEQGPPPASGWIESFDVCIEERILQTLLGPWYVPAYDGNYAFWAGGGCYNGDVLLHNSNYVEQTFFISDGTTHITFWYMAARALTGDNTLGDDISYLEIDGTDVWTLDLSTQDNDTIDLTTRVGNFVQDAIDVTAIAGSTVSLRFGHKTGSESGWGNTLFDQIELVTCTLDNAVLHLRDGTVSSLEDHEACFSIYVGPELVISPTGDLILHAPNVSFRRGFSVLGGGTLSVGS